MPCLVKKLLFFGKAADNGFTTVQQGVANMEIKGSHIQSKLNVYQSAQVLGKNKDTIASEKPEAPIPLQDRVALSGPWPPYLTCVNRWFSRSGTTCSVGLTSLTIKRRRKVSSENPWLIKLPWCDASAALMMHKFREMVLPPSPFFCGQSAIMFAHPWRRRPVSVERSVCWCRCTRFATRRFHIQLNGFETLYGLRNVLFHVAQIALVDG